MNRISYFIGVVPTGFRGLNMDSEVLSFISDIEEGESGIFFNISYVTIIVFTIRVRP